MRFIETLTLVPVPAAEPVVEQWRSRYDGSSKRGVPAHITLIYPFQAPEKIEEKLESELKTFFEGISPFSFELASVGTFSQKVIYLAPEPKEPFTDLVQKFVALYPDTPPYAGEYQTYSPHLTLAVLSQKDDFPGILKAIIQDVAPKLPLKAEAREAWLMLKDEAHLWQLKSKFKLGK